MNNRKGVLSENDHSQLDELFGRILDAYNSGKASKEDLILSIAQVIGAIDIGNIGEVREWTKNPGNLEYQLTNSNNL